MFHSGATTPEALVRRTAAANPEKLPISMSPAPTWHALRKTKGVVDWFSAGPRTPKDVRKVSLPAVTVWLRRTRPSSWLVGSAWPCRATWITS